MTPNDEKIDKFQSAIHHYATQQRNKILQEVEAYRSRVLEQARHCLHEVLPAMRELRKWADALEEVVADDLWPLPSYQEMLFMK